MVGMAMVEWNLHKFNMIQRQDKIEKDLVHTIQKQISLDALLMV